MRLWPRSLLGRNALLLAALIVLAELASAVLVRQLILVPRVERLGETVARTVSSLRAGLAALPREQRPAFVAAFASRNVGPVPDAAAAGDAAPPTDAPVVGLTPLERRFVRVVSARLAAERTAVVWRRDDDRSLSVRLAIEGDPYWIALPDVLPAREATGAWAAATAAAALLALAGAIAIQRRIDRPLRALVAAAEALGRGERPAPLDEGGPREIATVAARFNVLVASLDAAERERGLTLAGISHDLRTPLTKLRLGVEILADAAGPELLASMARSIDEMDRLVGAFVEHARAGDDAPLAREPTSLDALARELAAAFADEGRPVATVLDGGPPVAIAAALVRRAVVNLVENAWRHGAPPIAIETGHDAGRAWLEVVDHGPGIAPDALDALRRPFRRAATDAPGAGLGLSIAERIAARHGGRLELSAASPSGLRARFVVPR